jgi:PRTRC genetic system ParB family protein
VSALPGSHGEVSASLCFDAACNSQKVAAWRKAQRGGLVDTTGKQPKAVDKASSRKAATPTPATANQTPQRVKDFRLLQWRKWAAKALMLQPERNRRVMIALARCGHTGDVRAAEFSAAAKRIAGSPVSENIIGFTDALTTTDAMDAQHLERLMLAVAASAAFGVDARNLETLLNYLQVDERKYFKWSAEFLDLFTMSELESLASETGLKQKMGAMFKFARAKKKGDFIKSLLAVPGFAYEGTVPAVMRYPRKPVVSGQTDEASETLPIPAAEAPGERAEEAHAA